MYSRIWGLLSSIIGDEAMAAFKLSLQELAEIFNDPAHEKVILAEAALIHLQNLEALKLKNKSAILSMRSLTNQEHAVAGISPEVDLSIPAAACQWIDDDVPFYTLPITLLDKIVEHVGRECFAKRSLNCEYLCSEKMGDHSSRCGYWKGLPILSGIELDLNMASFLGETLQEQCANKVQAEHRAKNFVEFFNAQFIGKMAYSGWLMTNPKFLQELALFLNKYKTEVALFGLSTASLQFSQMEIKQSASIRKQLEQSSLKTLESSSTQRMPSREKTENYLHQLNEFLHRWHLESMAAPELPVPFQDHIGTTLLPTRKESSPRQISLSPTQAHPGTLELNRLLDQHAINFQANTNTAVWLRIIGHTNAAKNQIPRYARIFKIRHYWNAFQGRHQLPRANSKLIVAFAEHFKVSAQRIKQDRKLIRQAKQNL